MVAAVRVHKTGGPEVLTYEQIEVGAPGQGLVGRRQVGRVSFRFAGIDPRLDRGDLPIGEPTLALEIAVGITRQPRRHQHR